MQLYTFATAKGKQSPRGSFHDPPFFSWLHSSLNFESSSSELGFVRKGLYVSWFISIWSHIFSRSSMTEISSLVHFNTALKKQSPSKAILTCFKPLHSSRWSSLSWWNLLTLSFTFFCSNLCNLVFFRQLLLCLLRGVYYFCEHLSVLLFFPTVLSLALPLILLLCGPVSSSYSEESFSDSDGL